MYGVSDGESVFPATNPCVRIRVMRNDSVWLTAFCSVVRSKAVHSRSIQGRLPVPVLEVL